MWVHPWSSSSGSWGHWYLTRQNGTPGCHGRLLKFAGCSRHRLGVPCKSQSQSHQWQSSDVKWGTRNLWYISGFGIELAVGSHLGERQGQACKCFITSGHCEKMLVFPGNCLLYLTLLFEVVLSYHISQIKPLGEKLDTVTWNFEALVTECESSLGNVSRLKLQMKYCFLFAIYRFWQRLLCSKAKPKTWTVLIFKAVWVICFGKHWAEMYYAHSYD